MALVTEISPNPMPPLDALNIVGLGDRANNFPSQRSGGEQQRVNVILSFTDTKNKWKSLGDAYRVEASIIIDKAENTLLVPISSLFRQNEQWSVFKVVKGTANIQSVEVGRRNDRFAEITQGLNKSEQIITHPSNAIEEGVRVSQR